jgi:hypothetical protein
VSEIESKIETEMLPLRMADGSALPTVVVPNRARTNECWRRDDPVSYEEVVERILGLELNVSKLAEEFAGRRVMADGSVGCAVETMRRAIRTMIHSDDRLGLAKFRELKKMHLELVEAEMLDKVSELGNKARKGELLGAAAMAMKLTRDTLNAQGGAQTVVVRHEHSVSLDSDTLRRKEEIRRRLLGPVVDVECAEKEESQ